MMSRAIGGRAWSTAAGEREWAYNRESKVGKLDKALDEAPQRGWIVVDMKQDWKTVFQPR